MNSRVWSTKSAVLATVGFAAVTGSLIWLTWWLLDKGNDGAGIANVLALPLTAFGLIATVWGLNSRPRADDPEVLAAEARSALAKIITSESRALQRLLGDSGDTRAADIGFAQPAPADIHWRTDGGSTEGTSATIKDFLAGLERGRLVILGEPGSGKSVLALRLLLDLAEADHEKATGPGSTAERIRLPVRVSLSAFSTTAAATPAEVRDRLDEWLANQLQVVHGVRLAISRELVRVGWVLPILDGLDEMSEDGDRVATVLRALNLPQGPDRWPVILTCRSERYARTAADTWLQDATVVTLRPLDSRQIIDWLTYRFPSPGRPDGVQQRWQPVVNRVRRHPGGRLATCLSSPLHLYLATSGYQTPRSKPQELLGLTREQLNDRLFGQLLPAVVAHHPRPDCRHYAADEAHRWLRTFAEHLAHLGADGRSSSDLYLDQLPLATRKRHTKPWWIGVTSLWVVGFFILTQLLGAALQASGTPVKGLENATWIGFLTTAGLGAQYALFGTFGQWRLLRIEPRQALSRSGLRSLGLGMAIGLTGAAVFAPGASELVGTDIGVPLGLAVGLALGLTRGLSAIPSAAARPSDPVRQSMLHDLTFPVLFTIIVTVSAGPMIGLTFTTMVAVFLVIGSQWSHYLLTVLILARRGALPRRPARFLDWAYEAGLVRMSGIAVQFRHHELQAYLLAATQTQREEAEPVVDRETGATLER